MGEHFGFAEGPYGETRSKLDFQNGTLGSTCSSVRYYVGPFETPSLCELRTRLCEEMANLSDRNDGISFQNIVGEARKLHLDPASEGAVFQVASQFNCLEMPHPGVTPEDGVSDYFYDATQGPACALACPAATVYRNYFANEDGQTEDCQLDCLEDIGNAVENDENEYWDMVNGYCLPNHTGSISKLRCRFADDASLPASLREKLRVGVHWDTEVCGRTHRVCQVFCSGLPLGYASGTKKSDWEPFACCVLDATFEATLAIAAILALERNTRVRVYLTAVGGGVFGNRSEWIADAVARALRIHARSPLDVKFVHFGALPPKSSKLMTLECDSRRALLANERQKADEAQGDKAVLTKIKEIKALLGKLVSFLC